MAGKFRGDKFADLTSATRPSHVPEILEYAAENFREIADESYDLGDIKYADRWMIVAKILDRAAKQIEKIPT